MMVPAKKAIVKWSIPETVWQAIIAAVVTIVLAFMQMQTKVSVDAGNLKVDEAIVKADAAVETVKEAVKEVAEDQEKKLDVIDAVANKTHSLVNHDSLAKDKIVALVLKQLSLLTKDPKDIETARLAEVVYEENLAKQTMLDARAFPETEPKP